MNESILRLEDVSFQYPDGTVALKNISMSFPRHKKIAILGNNGCGKSTLMLHLNGIFKPTEGTVYFDETPFSYRKKDIEHIRKQVGIVFQNPDMQLFSTDVYQDIAFGALNIWKNEKQAKPFIEKAIQQMKVEPFLEKPIHFLSYGQKKRVALAGILAMDPEVVVLDEPTAGLDPFYIRLMIESLESIYNAGKTIILSTHDIDFAYEWADIFIVMSEGTLLDMGDHSYIFSNHRLIEKAHLQQPWITLVYEELVKNKVASGQVYPTKKDEILQMLRRVGEV